MLLHEKMNIANIIINTLTWYLKCHLIKHSNLSYSMNEHSEHMQVSQKNIRAPNLA